MFTGLELLLQDSHFPNTIFKGGYLCNSLFQVVVPKTQGDITEWENIYYKLICETIKMVSVKIRILKI